jgi:large-conductance mechanosensitive channel
VVKLMNKAMRSQKAAPAPPAPPPVEQQLLGEIRDLLKARA